MVATQLVSYLEANNLAEPFQSRYIRHHSTDTALTFVSSDPLMLLDKKKSILLISLDLSAAFDLVIHRILIDHLEQHHVISGTVLTRFESYLTNWSQRVSIGGATSENRLSSCGVPQGSVLGSNTFTMYTEPLGDIVHKYGLFFSYLH